MNAEVEEIDWEDLKAAVDFYDELKKEEHKAAADFYDKLIKEEHFAMQKREQSILQHQRQKFDNFIKTGSYYP